MYYVIKLNEKIRVPPSLFSMEKNEAIKEILAQLYEKTINRDNGLIVNIQNAKATSKGIVIPGDPNVYYSVEYEALAFNVKVNEIFLGKVTDIMEFGAFVNIGAFEGLLHISQIGKESFRFNRKSKTLVTQDANKSIKKGDTLIVKVSTVSLKSKAAEVKISLSTKEEGLGKPEWNTAPKVKKQPKKKK